MRRFEPTKKDIEAKISEAQSRLSEARQAIRNDEFTTAVEALGEAERCVDATSELVSERWTAVDHHREELIEYHRRELERLANAPQAVNATPQLRSVE